MKETILLTKTFIKNGFRSGEKGKTKICLYIAICIYFSVFTLYISFNAMNVLKNLMLENLFIQTIIVMDVLLICMQSVVSSLNMFYFSDDIEFVLPLPVEYKNLYQSKLNVLIFSEYIFEILFFLAPLIFFGTVMNLGVMYYIKMILVLLFVPMIVCSIISFFTIRLVGIFKNLKNKDKVQYVSMIFALIIVLLISTMSFGETGQGLTEAEIIDIVLNLNEGINYKENIFNKFVNVVSFFLISNDLSIVLTNLIRIILIVLICYRGITLINYKTYKNNISINFNNGSNKNIKKLNKGKETTSGIDYERFLKNTKQLSILKSYVIKEFKNLLRVPMFFMQCVLPTIVFPIVMLVPFAININNLEVLDMPPLEELKKLVLTKEGISVIIIIMQVLYLMNVNQVTAISRDNKNSTFMKIIPISLYKQCVYKLIPGIILNIIPTIYLSLILVFVLDFKVLDMAVIFITLLILNVLESFALILIDLKRPKLNWDSEATVVKQNMNIIVGYFIQIIMCAIIVTAIIYFGNTILNSLIIINVMMLIMIFIVTNYIKKNEKRLFSKIY